MAAVHSMKKYLPPNHSDHAKHQKAPKHSEVYVVGFEACVNDHSEWHIDWIVEETSRRRYPDDIHSGETSFYSFENRCGLSLELVGVVYNIIESCQRTGNV